MFVRCEVFESRNYLHEEVLAADTGETGAECVGRVNKKVNQENVTNHDGSENVVASDSGVEDDDYHDGWGVLARVRFTAWYSHIVSVIATNCELYWAVLWCHCRNLRLEYHG